MQKLPDIKKLLERIQKLLNRYGLALCCVIAPLVLGYAAPNFVGARLFPTLSGNPFNFVFVTETIAVPAPPVPAGCTAPTPGTCPVPPPDATPSKEHPKILQMGAISDTLAGRYGYVAMSGFLYLVSVAALLFAGVVVVLRLGWSVLAAGFVVFCGIGYLIATGPTAYEAGGTLLIDKLLDAADKSPVFKPLTDLQSGVFATSAALKRIININTFVAIVPVGLVLVAFAALARRDDRDLTSSDADAAKRAMLIDLRARMNAMRGMLALASAILVIAVLASKTLLDWPLKLLAKTQADVLKPLAEAITNHLGVSGSIALFAAAAPAVTAWSLDVDRYRAAVAGGIAPSTPPTDGLSLAPLPVISNMAVVLAPVLAGPIAELLKWAAKLGSGGT